MSKVRIYAWFEKNKINVFLLIASALFTLGLIEGLNYLIVINSEDYYVWPPNLNQTFYPREDILFGIQGASVFTINKLGYRGPLIEDKDEEYRIIVMGGSTTECKYLDNMEAWPTLLMDLLGEANDGREVKVINIGKSGHSTSDHILQFKYLVNKYQPDLVILSVGVNDMLLRIMYGNKWKPYDEKNPNYNKAFYYSPEYTIRSSIFYKILRSFYINFYLKEKPEDIYGLIYIERRDLRMNAPKIDKVPYHKDGLKDYSKNLNILIDLSRKSDVKMLFVTQPYLWKENTSTIEENSLWMINDPNGNFFSTMIMAYLMDKYNQKLLEVCSENKDVLCFDLSKEIPKTLDYFYDDVHSNEGGSIKVATELSNYITGTIPLFEKFEFDQ